MLLLKLACRSCCCKLFRQTEELWSDLMSFVSSLNTSDITDAVDLMTPDISSLLNHLVHSDIDNINFTSFDILVCWPSISSLVTFV